VRIQVFQHVAYEGAGTLAEWAEHRGHSLAFTQWHLGDPAPAFDSFDFLVILGGPMNVGEEAAYPWLRAEKAFLDAILAADRPVLGICLGAQLLAERLGGAVVRNAWREIGWHAVERPASAQMDEVFSALPQRFEAFHWHGDTFAIPPGARHGLFSEACAAQAFRVRHCIGLQCHLEFSKASIQGLIEASKAEGESFMDRYVQQPEAFLARTDLFEQLREINFELLDRISASAD